MNTTLEVLAKGYPLIIEYGVILAYLILKDKEILYVAILLWFSKLLNYILKNFLFKPILGNKKYAVIGTGRRPLNARNCGVMKKTSKTNSKTYGMPSGHSQMSVLFSTYLLYKIFDGNMENNLKVILSVILIIIPLYVMYSRIYFNCHTIQQVVMGGLIGYTISYLFYFRKLFK